MSTSGAIKKIQPLTFPWQTLDPFLFCVHHDDAYPVATEKMGPVASLAGRDLGQDLSRKDGWSMYHGEVVPGFPQHPHRGFETVTYVRGGLIDHADSLGASARFGQGDAQWITAGKGLSHSEMFPLLDREKPNPLELFQIWLNLPSSHKLSDPFFSVLWGDSIPSVVEKDESGLSTEVHMVAGSYAAKNPPSPPPNSWAARKENDVAIWTVKIAPGAKWTLPKAAAGLNRVLYFFRGSTLHTEKTVVNVGHSIELRSDLGLTIENGPDESEFLLLQGKPIGEPVAQHGPFVMNTNAELHQAFADYQKTSFGGWPWPSDEPVFPPDEPRFARYPDGTTERKAK